MSEQGGFEMPETKDEYEQFVQEIDQVLTHMATVQLDNPFTGLGVMDDEDVNALVKEAQRLLRAARGLAISRSVTGRPHVAGADQALIN
jgi:hypothetical protein